MAARKTPARTREVDLPALVPMLRETLNRERVLNTAALNRLGVPRAQHSAAIALLTDDGFERLKTGVRVPLRAQILALIAEREQAPIRQLARLLRGATQKEATTVATAIAKEGLIHTVIRGKVEAITTQATPTLSREQLAELSRACRALATQAGRALKRAPMTLLRDDVRALLLDLVAPAPATLAKIARPSTLLELVTEELPRHLHASVGLAFVPETVSALVNQGNSVPAIQAALLDAHRAQRIELQPESGLDRLSREQLELCPPGPQGTRLSWARLLEVRA